MYLVGFEVGWIKRFTVYFHHFVVFGVLFVSHHFQEVSISLWDTDIFCGTPSLTGWAPHGQRLVDHAAFGHWRRQTFVAAPRHDRLDAPWVMDGTMNRTTVDTYVETQLAPVLSKGDVIILDNLSSHKSQ